MPRGTFTIELDKDEAYLAQSIHDYLVEAGRSGVPISSVVLSHNALGGGGSRVTVTFKHQTILDLNPITHLFRARHVSPPAREPALVPLVGRFDLMG